MLRYEFSDAEITSIARDQGQKLRDRDTLTAEKKRVAKQYATRIETLDGEIDADTDKITTGYEMRMIECLVYYDQPEAGHKSIVRSDTGTLVRTERMTQSEMQREMEFKEKEVESNKPEQPLIESGAEDDDTIIDAEEVDYSFPCECSGYEWNENAVCTNPTPIEVTTPKGYEMVGNFADAPDGKAYFGYTISWGGSDGESTSTPVQCYSYDIGKNFGDAVIEWHAKMHRAIEGQEAKTKDKKKLGALAKIKLSLDAAAEYYLLQNKPDPQEEWHDADDNYPDPEITVVVETVDTETYTGIMTGDEENGEEIFEAESDERIPCGSIIRWRHLTDAETATREESADE